MLYLADDRKQSSLDGTWPTLTPAQRDRITAVAMDTGEPYMHSTRVHLPEADSKIVFEKFHASSNICTTPSTGSEKKNAREGV